MIEAKIIVDSISEAGSRLTTFELKFPKIYLQEFNTHRDLSRNASSTRAQPVTKLIEQVQSDPYIPTAFGKNKKGMQSSELLTEDKQSQAKTFWLSARDSALNAAVSLKDLEVHKQHCGRILEPFLWVTVIATATNWDNFFALRNHQDAQPEMQELAQKMLLCYTNRQSKLLSPKEWHLPYLKETDKELPIDVQVKCSVARCCRVSYNNHDGTETNTEKDIELHDMLIKNGHMSPTEHQAYPSWSANIKSGNFRGWYQYRKTIKNEYRTFNYEKFVKSLEGASGLDSAPPLVL